MPTTRSAALRSLARGSGQKHDIGASSPTKVLSNGLSNIYLDPTTNIQNERDKEAPSPLVKEKVSKRKLKKDENTCPTDIYTQRKGTTGAVTSPMKQKQPTKSIRKTTLTGMTSADPCNESVTCSSFTAMTQKDNLAPTIIPFITSTPKRMVAKKNSSTLLLEAENGNTDLSVSTPEKVSKRPSKIKAKTSKTIGSVNRLKKLNADVKQKTRKQSKNASLFSPTYESTECTTESKHQMITRSRKIMEQTVQLSEFPTDEKQEEMQLDIIEESTVAIVETTTEKIEEYIDPFDFIRTLPPIPDHYRNRPYVLPKKARNAPKITLVVDLDETLVHCDVMEIKNSSFNFAVEYDGDHYKVFAKTRPYWREFLQRLCTKFELIIFTASQKEYANKLLDVLDPDKKLIKYRVFRDSCVFVNGNFIKDLSVLGRDMSKVMIVDNAIQAFAYQVSNGIPIESWYEDEKDTELETLCDFIETLENVDDVRPIIDAKFNLKKMIELN